MRSVMSDRDRDAIILLGRCVCPSVRINAVSAKATEAKFCVLRHLS